MKNCTDLFKDNTYDNKKYILKVRYSSIGILNHIFRMTFGCSAIAIIRLLLLT